MYSQTSTNIVCECHNSFWFRIPHFIQHFLGFRAQTLWIMESSLVDEYDLSCPIGHIEFIVLSKRLLVRGIVLEGVSPLDRTGDFECSVDSLLLNFKPLGGNYSADILPDWLTRRACVEQRLPAVFNRPTAFHVGVVLRAIGDLDVYRWRWTFIRNALNRIYYWRHRSSFILPIRCLIVPLNLVISFKK